MALPTPNMDDCCKKERCLGGPNAGQIFKTCDPCQGKGDFNPETCDCEIAPYWYALHWWTDSHIASDATCSPSWALSNGYPNVLNGASESGLTADGVNYGSWELGTATQVTFGNCTGLQKTSQLYKIVLYDGTEVNPVIGINQPAQPLVIETPSFYPAYYWYRIGTTVGYGDTSQEAQADAETQAQTEANLVPPTPPGP